MTGQKVRLRPHHLQEQCQETIVSSDQCQGVTVQGMVSGRWGQCQGVGEGEEEPHAKRTSPYSFPLCDMARNRLESTPLICTSPLPTARTSKMAVGVRKLIMRMRMMMMMMMMMM
ncbi:hypothetical protein E2C01_050895 [Portunus trituberculatus]|uniref:Uncharacterized protein n=1 Tax=Portunus trituberculatus TaxID=210409 RepID=A0A5B7GI52_PORTR|nr:hypothetical protein [Portunus trituberculatus]